MTEGFTPKIAAETMILKYGRDRAIKYASGYASGVYFEQPEHKKVYWRQVVQELKTMKDKPR